MLPFRLRPSDDAGPIAPADRPGFDPAGMAMSDQVSFTTFGTPHGFVALAWNLHGICSLRLPAVTERAAEMALRKRLPSAHRAAPPTSVARVIDDVVSYFSGTMVHFATVPIDLGQQDAFFTAIYGEVRQLGWGETTTYGTLAKRLGAEPQAARDVGRAMALNPVPLIVPCHRVLGAGGTLGGFSAPGGSVSKARMLELEGIRPAADLRPRRARSAPQAGQASLDL